MDMVIFPLMPWFNRPREKCTKIFRYLEILDSGEQHINSATKFTILKDKVYRIVQLPHKTLYQVYISTSLRNQLFHIFHDHPLAVHLERYKTYKRLQALAYWPKISLDVTKYVKCCQTCQVQKPENQRHPGKLQQTMVRRPWDMLGVDIMGPFPRSSAGNVYLFLDYYSRWVELFTLRRATAESVSQVLNREILTCWGVPNYILSRQDSQFVSSVFAETCKKWNLK